MTKRADKHRYSTLVNVLYALAVLSILIWVMLLFTEAAPRLAALAFTLAHALPLVAFGIDIWNKGETT